MKLAVTALITLLVAALLYIGFAGNGGSAKEVNPDSEPKPAQVVTGLESSGQMQLPDENALIEDERAAIDAPHEPELKVKEKPKGRLIQGSVIIVADDGQELHGLDGKLKFDLRRQDSRWNERETDVKEGRFSLRVYRSAELHVIDLVIGGRSAYVKDDDQNFNSNSDPIVIRAHWANPLRLNVLSASTGEHLDDIKVVRGYDAWMFENPQLPGRIYAQSLVLNGVTSPIEVFPSTSELKRENIAFFVYSPGFAWKAIGVIPTAGGEREIRLDPGGSVTITLVGDRSVLNIESRGWDPVVELHTSKPFQESRSVTKGYWTSEDDPIELVGVPPGKYFAIVRFFDHLLGEAEIEVVAGAHREYELLLIEPEEDELDEEFESPYVDAELFELAGTISGTAAWQLPAFRIKAWRIQDLGNDPGWSEVIKSRDLLASGGGDDSWSFSFGKVPKARYALEFAYKKLGAITEHTYLVDLIAGADLPFHVKLAPPATVVVNLIDQATGESAKTKSIAWLMRSDSGDYASQSVVKRKEGESHFEFVTPPGNLVITDQIFSATGKSIDDEPVISDYVKLNESLEVFEGLNEFSFEARHLCKLKFSFTDGATPIPAPRNWNSNIWENRPKHLDGQGEIVSTFTGGGVSFSEPGRYLIHSSQLDGFEPVPDQVVVVERGKLSTHEVQLVRRK